jgi:hypothetical protein
MTPESLPEPIEVALGFTRVLDELGVRYVIGGSLASSVHGEPRTTNDIDIVADLLLDHVDPLVAAVSEDFYVSPAAAREAIRRAGSFNLIHLKKAVKVDVFVAGEDPLNAERLRDRTRVQAWSEPEAWLFVDTPEHSVLRKLDWYRRGGEVSERQWRDVLGILRVQSGAIDRERLDTWATRLGIANLLRRALDESDA